MYYSIIYLFTFPRSQAIYIATIRASLIRLYRCIHKYNIYVYIHIIRIRYIYRYIFRI